MINGSYFHNLINFRDRAKHISWTDALTYTQTRMYHIFAFVSSLLYYVMQWSCRLLNIYACLKQILKSGSIRRLMLSSCSSFIQCATFIFPLILRTCKNERVHYFEMSHTNKCYITSKFNQQQPRLNGAYNSFEKLNQERSSRAMVSDSIAFHLTAILFLIARYFI